MFPSSNSGYTQIPTTNAPPTIPTYSSAPPAANRAANPAPSPSPAEAAAGLFTRIKEQGHALIAAQRPWPQLLNAALIRLPSSPADAIARLRINTLFFRSNYTLAIAATLALALLWHPGSLLVFAALAAAWFFLFFARSAPLVIGHRTVDDGAVLGFLGAATAIALLFTDVGANLLGAFFLGLGLVLVHAVFRATDDLPVEELPVTMPAAAAPIASAAAAAAFGVPAQQQQQGYVRVGR